MRYASAKGRLLKATFNNNLPNQTGDVIVNPINPENPDSKSGCKYVISYRRLREVLVFWEYFL
jgi:hypothetical protein